ncbi:MAG: hypothetical protein ABEL97_08235, partial [Salinibacter sp.]
MPPGCPLGPHHWPPHRRRGDRHAVHSP